MILDDGSAVCWAFNNYGQATPPTLTYPQTFVQIVCGWQFTCARISNGSVQCWGQNDYGQTTVPSLSSSGVAFVSISAGIRHMCGILSDNSAMCWGENAAGQTNIVALAPNLRYVQMACGYVHSCGLVNDGTVRCWGGGIVAPTLASPLQFVQIAFACGVVSDGTISCWFPSMGAVPVISRSFVQVATGSFQVIALTSDGSFACWGSQNGAGQLNIPAALQQPFATRTTPAGYYRLGSIATACPVGRFASTSDHMSPMCERACAAGTYCPAGSSGPLACEAGFYCAAGSVNARGGVNFAGTGCALPVFALPIKHLLFRNPFIASPIENLLYRCVCMMKCRQQ